MTDAKELRQFGAGGPFSMGASCNGRIVAHDSPIPSRSGVRTKEKC